jgi:hypothetical protein
MKTRFVIGSAVASLALLCAAPAIAQQASGYQSTDNSASAATQQSNALQQSSTQSSDANQGLPAWFVDPFRGGA